MPKERHIAAKGDGSSRVSDDGLRPKDKDDIRSYLRSKRLVVLSWAITALLIASFVFQQYSSRLLYAAAALSFLAMLPLLGKVRNRRIDFQSQADRRYLVFVVILVGGVILFSILYTMYQVKR
jgi:Na+/H+ antiporter NhaD/arsenite permease-like protein